MKKEGQGSFPFSFLFLIISGGFIIAFSSLFLWDAGYQVGGFFLYLLFLL